MTVQAIRPGGEVVAGLSAARRALESASAVPVVSLPDEELMRSVESASVPENQTGAFKLALLAEADRRRLAKRLGATGTDAWAAQLTGTTRGVMAGGVWLAGMLEEKYDATREAFAAGGITQAQARVIVRAAEQLPTTVTAEERKAAEAGLVAKAVHGMDPKGLRRAGRRMLDKAATLTRQQVDAHESDQLEKEEKRAERETNFAMWQNQDGTWSGKFTVPDLHASLLKAYLDRLCSPSRLATNAAGETVSDETVENGVNIYEKRGSAFCELIEHLPTEGFGRGGIGVMVHLDYQHLLDRLASARLDTGVDITAGQARRLACTAGIIPIVLSGDSVVLDLGRTHRLHTASQAKALSVNHETCAAEGCHRPFAWCDIHHVHPWSQGGPTDLANARPLCGWHHRRAHDDAFNMTVLPTGEVRYRRRR